MFNELKFNTPPYGHVNFRRNMTLLKVNLLSSAQTCGLPGAARGETNKAGWCRTRTTGMALWPGQARNGSRVMPMGDGDMAMT